MTNNYQGGNPYLDINNYTSQADMYKDLDLPFYYHLGDMLKFEGTFLLLVMVSSFLSYLFIAIALQKIARRLRIANDWQAWIPVMNLLLLLKIVKKPQSLIFIFFIPVVGVLFGITIWMELATVLSKPRWLGVLMAIPFVNIFVVLYFAYADDYFGVENSNITVIKGSSEAFAYDSKIIAEKGNSKSDDQIEDLNQLEKDLQELQKKSQNDQEEADKKLVI